MTAAGENPDAEPNGAATIRAIGVYLEGDYLKAIQAFEDILASDPENPIARQYLQKATSDLVTGQVPRRRLPLDALEAQARGRYYQLIADYGCAEEHYRRALTIAKAGGVSHWAELDEEVAALRARAAEHRDRREVDQLVAAGQFEAALEALPGLADHIPGELRFQLEQFLPEALQAEGIVAAIRTGETSAAVTVLEQLRLARVLAGNFYARFPTSDRIRNLVMQIDDLASEWVERVVIQAQYTLTRLPAVTSLQERKLIAADTIRQLELADTFDHDQSLIALSVQNAQRHLDEVDYRIDILEQIEAAGAASNRAANQQIYSLLREHTDISADPLYRKAAATLYNRLCAAAEAAFAAGDREAVEHSLGQAEYLSPFLPIEVESVDELRRRLESAKRLRQRGRRLLLTGAALLVFAAVALVVGLATLAGRLEPNGLLGR